MRIANIFLTVAGALAYLFLLANASSRLPLPLKRMQLVTDAQIRRIDAKGAEAPTNVVRRSSKHILHSDTIRLYFRAFSQDFYLHLQPSENLIAEEGAVVRYTSFDPTLGTDVVRRTETIHAHDVRAFQGAVMHRDYTGRRLAEDRVGFRRDANADQSTESDEGLMGRASIILHDDGSDSGRIRFEGVFDWAGNEHVIQSPSNYHSTRSEHDPIVSKRSMQMETMVIHRHSDRMNDHEASLLGIRSSSTESGCNADKYEYNVNNALRIPSSDDEEGLDSTLRMLDPLSFFVKQSKLGRRSLSLPDVFGFSAGHLPRSKSPSLALSQRGRRAVTRRRDVDLSTGQESYSYHDAFAKRQGDLLGGTNNNSYIDEIGSTTGCPTANRVVYIGMATDCTYTGRFSNSSDARVAVLNDMNTVSNLYRNTFRVALGVVEMEIREATDCPTTGQGNSQWNRQCDDSYGLDQRLSDFSAWRSAQPANGTGLWHLLTTCRTGSEVGVAWLGTLCKTDRSGSGSNVVSGTGVTASTSNEAQTIAHEIGHNFGAVHDCISGCSINGNLARQGASGGGAICCPQSSGSCNSNGQYIMSPVSTGASSEQFSPCSVGNICSMLRQGLDTSCVEDPAQTQRETLSVQQCGNGIVEPGEECDAGPNGSQCCTSNCRLTSGSVCDPESSPCCTNQCQFAGTSTVCRAAIDSRCDTAEMCTGNSAECPEDVRKDNGESCGNGLQCAAGHCTSRDLQCQQQSSADYNFTEACPLNADNSCSVSCRDPRQTNACAILQQNFIDGTECGYGGYCQGGECQSGSWQETFRAWYRQNLRISIPVTIVVGVIVLAILYGLLRCLCLPLFARKTGRKVPGGAAPMMGGRRRRANGTNNQHSSHYASYAPPPQHPNGYGGGHDVVSAPEPAFRGSTNGWADPYSYNGRTGSSYPTH